MTQLIDFILSTHPARNVLEKTASERGVTNFEGEIILYLRGSYSNMSCFLSVLVLEEELERLRKEQGVESLIELTRDLHFYPDLHGMKENYLLSTVTPGSKFLWLGNRSPIADSRMTGSIVGLTLVGSRLTAQVRLKPYKNSRMIASRIWPKNSASR